MVVCGRRIWSINNSNQFMFTSVIVCMHSLNIFCQIDVTTMNQVLTQPFNLQNSTVVADLNSSQDNETGPIFNVKPLAKTGTTTGKYEQIEQSSNLMLTTELAGNQPADNIVQEDSQQKQGWRVTRVFNKVSLESSTPSTTPGASAFTPIPLISSQAENTLIAIETETGEIGESGATLKGDSTFQNGNSITDQPFTNLIPGCESLLTFDPTRFEGNSIPLCFCDEEVKKSLTISCFDGATLSELNKTLNSVRKAGWKKPIHQIYVTNLEMEDQPMQKGFFEGLQVVDIRLEGCRGVVNIEDGALKGLEFTLQSLQIQQCYFDNGNFPEIFRGHAALKKISLYRNGISKQINADSFEDLVELKSLDLSRNDIEGVHAGGFKSLQSLEFLNLENNQLTNSIWSELNQLQQLRNLTIRRNKISDFPENALSNLIHLDYLDLSENTFSQLKQNALSGLANLSVLKLQGNGINKADAMSFKDLPKLEHLLLDVNDLKETDLALVNTLPDLKILGLRSNKFNYVPSDSFYKLSSLTDLELGLNYNLDRLSPFSFRGLKSLEKLGLHNTPLKHLNNSISADVLPSLKELDFSGSVLTEVPVDFFGKATQIEVVKLYRGLIEVVSDPEVFESLSSLRVLDVSENPYICNKKLVGFVTWLQRKANDMMESTSSTLEVVDLEDTQCDSPESLKDVSLDSLDSADMIDPISKNETSAEDSSDPFDWNDLADDFEINPAMQYLLKNSDRYLVVKKSNAPLATAIVGAMIAIVIASSVIGICIATRKRENAERIKRIH